MDKVNFPITRASLNLTRACNLRCSYCFTHGCTKGSMPVGMAFKIVDYLYKNAVESKTKIVEIDFWGGEPLIEWDLLKRIVLYAEKTKPKSVELRFGGTTNGTLLTSGKLDFLDRHRIFFLISIDGRKEVHDRFRKYVDGRGSHDVIMENMKAALEVWPFLKARLSPSVENIDGFYEDVKYLIEFGFKSLMFSPVYEGNWTEERWKVFEDQCMKICDLMAEYKKKKGTSIKIDHFLSYSGPDASKWPCGSGRFYVGIDVDGAIYPCHRMNKFDDDRPWQEKEVCIGHIDHGITRPEFREMFYDDKHTECGECERLKDTPCNGGCWAVKYDLAGGVHCRLDSLCIYTNLQKRVSDYYASLLGYNMTQSRGKSCLCYNMCYAQGTEHEIINDDGGTHACMCNNAYYSGPIDQPGLGVPIQAVKTVDSVIKALFGTEK